MASVPEVMKKVFDDKGKPISSWKMTFDSQQAQLEPIYYWLLDFVKDGKWDVKKTTDNFMSSPGSGHFQDMGTRATRMQEEGMKILGGLNQTVKSALNLVYDLKEFELRLLHYRDANSEDKEKREEGILALKQIWLDNVDLKRGRGSIHQMATMEMGFTILREAFMMANSVEELKKMNSEDVNVGGGGVINDQVMRILIPRIGEFLKWVELSEKELTKRMNIEKSYLKSQVETIKLYSQWMKPYIKAANELRQEGFDKDAALVNAFSTSMFRLEFIGTKKAKVPEKFEGYRMKRDYTSIVVIGLEYRGHVSQRVTQKGDYAFAMGGRVDMTFDSFALNEEEFQLFEKELNGDDVEESMEFSSDVAADALKELKEDLDYFLKSDEEKEKEEKAKTKKEGEDINPFSALFGLFKFWGKDKKKDKKNKKEINDLKDIKKDNFVEKEVRKVAEEQAASWLYLVYDIYKKAHGMASAPDEGFDVTLNS